MELSIQQHHDQSLIVEGVAFPSQYSVELKNLSSVANDITNTDDDGRNSIEKPSENDVLTGRGASINANPGNKKFRALCFARKAYFDAGNHAAKRRVANEIVTTCMEQYGSRFLHRDVVEATDMSSSQEGDGANQRFVWFTMTKEEAILKASQVMRDYKRPDRLAQRELMAVQGRRRKRFATPMDRHIDTPLAPEAPLVENPFGVNSNDVICGRGAFANEHSGNKRLRQLAIERKARFEAGNYSEKKMLAHEIVKLIGDLNPPGRFLKRIPSNQRVDPADPLVAVSPTEDECGWCQLEDDMAVQKACQVMRDISRPDRQERDEMRRLRRLTKDGRTIDNPEIARATVASVDFPVGVGIVIADDAAAERGEYVVNTTDQALDRTLEGV